MTARRITAQRTSARLSSRRVPSLPVPEGLVRQGVALRRLRARDAGPFAAAFRDDPELGVVIGAEEDPTENGVRRFIARQPGLRARGEFLGHVMLHTLAWRHKRAEVGYWLVPAARGHGIGSAAVSLLVDWAFDELEFERIEITTTPDNGPARALAKTLGFVEEGVMIGRNLERGRRVDVMILARLRK
jgi:RimJ/RimL family protein N-acetyltransferase